MSGSKYSLSTIHYFEALAPHELDALERLCHWRRYRADQQIIGHLDDTNDVYFIVSGAVRVIVYSASGKEVMFTDLEPGKIVGELSAIDGKPRSATVIALSDTLLATMTAETFLSVLQDHPEVARRLMTYLVGLVRRLSDRVVEFSVLAVRNRIHAELMRLAREHGVVGNTAVIEPSPTHAEMASRISTHREAVTREMNALAREGLIERRHGGIVICDIAKLARLVETVRHD